MISTVNYIIGRSYAKLLIILLEQCKQKTKKVNDIMYGNDHTGEVILNNLQRKSEAEYFKQKIFFLKKKT